MAKRARRKHPPGVPARWSSATVNTGSRMTPHIMPLMHGRATGWSFRQEYPEDAVHKHAQFYLKQQASNNRRVLILQELVQMRTEKGMLEKLSEYNRVKLLIHGKKSWWLYFSGNNWHIVYDDLEKEIVMVSCRYSSRSLAYHYYHLGRVSYTTVLDTPPKELPG